MEPCIHDSIGRSIGLIIMIRFQIVSFGFTYFETPHRKVKPSHKNETIPVGSTNKNLANSGNTYSSAIL